MPSLSEAELQWRQGVGARVKAAIGNAQLSLNDVAELAGDNVANVSQYTRGLRNIPPRALARIARVTGVTVEDLLNIDGPPLPPLSRTGRCREQLVLESSGPGYRIVVLLNCDQPEHEPEEDHHDTRGFSWRPDAE